MSKREPMTEFLGTLGRIQIELDRITEYTNEDHMNGQPDNITWADVGDAKRLLEQLREVATS